MRVVSGSQSCIEPALYARVAGYRHQVFVERLGWQLRADEGRELDQFDRPDTLYVIAQDDADEVFGCARLLPTTGPCLMSEVFPGLIAGPPPCDPRIWELSRFACGGAGGGALADFPRSDTARLMEEVMACARRHGAERLVTVTWLGIERLLRRLAIPATRAGKPVRMGGQWIFACWIDLAG
jgi:N-acyl-L-homoserine lactone synthetase